MKFLVAIIGVSALLGVAVSQRQCYDDRVIVKRLMEDYEKKSPDPGATVTVELWVSDLIQLSQKTGEMDFLVYTSYKWEDRQLNYTNWMQGKVKPCNQNITADTDIDIWTPALTFINDRNTELQSSPLKNVYYSIFPNGTVWIVNRLQVKIPCSYSLEGYPQDEMKCKVLLESYRYRLSECDVRWSEMAIMSLKKLETSEFTLSSSVGSRVETLYPAGQWAELQATFTFKRNLGFPVFSLFLPSAIILLVSWMAFLLHPSSLTPRILLSTQAILAHIYLVWWHCERFPILSFYNPVSLWLGIALLFALGSLFETIIAYHWSTVCSKRRAHKYRYVTNAEEDGKHLFHKTSDYTCDDEDEAARGGRCWRFCSSVVDYVAVFLFPIGFAVFSSLFALGIF